MDDFLGYARLAEAVIQDAFHIVTRRKKDMEAIEKVLEFANRKDNRLLSEYCQAFELDEERVRSALVRRCEEVLN